MSAIPREIRERVKLASKASDAALKEYWSNPMVVAQLATNTMEGLGLANATRGAQIGEFRPVNSMELLNDLGIYDGCGSGHEPSAPSGEPIQIEADFDGAFVLTDYRGRTFLVVALQVSEG